ILPDFARKTPSMPDFGREPHVTHSRGMAFLDKNKIRFTGGFKAYPGDVVRVGEQEYILKTFKKNNLPVYLAAGAIVIFLVVLMVVLGSSPTKNSGNLVGIVLEKGSQALLPNATVKINELGKKVVTDNLGFFQFDLLPPGSYTLEASLGGYSTGQGNVAVVKKKTANLALVMIPTSKELYSKLNLKDRETPSPVNLEVPTKTERTGTIKIQSNVSNALVMLDNNMLGVGNKTYANITPGPHTLRVTKENYQDWESKIQIKPGVTQTFGVDLNPLKTQTAKFTKPQTYEDYLTLANGEYKDGNYNKAASYYSGALSLKTKSGDALMGRANSYLKLQDKKKAVTDYYSAGKIFQENNSNAKAIEAYTSIIDISESNTNAFYERGNSYLQTGQFDKSIKDFETAISESPKFFLAYLRLGYAHYKANNYKESIDSYDKARKLNPNSKHVYIGLAKTYQAMGNKSNAKKNYEKFRELTTYVDREALKDDPEWKAVLDFIGVKEDQ
ncbi:MAG TPA: tetratricopeptide repeat protein, partial [candidate division Zixibacteria bacterium]|nr:tetratricopeptide repeat protein [candidate division Zixibacteria bacterium]